MRPGAQELHQEFINEDDLSMETWEKNVQELYNFWQQVYETAKERMGSEKGTLWFGNKFFEHAKKLKREFGQDAESFRSWHILIGSTVTPSNDTKALFGSKFDYPEPYSVRTFLEDCNRELDELESKKDEKA